MSAPAPRRPLPPKRPETLVELVLDLEERSPGEPDAAIELPAQEWAHLVVRAQQEAQSSGASELIGTIARMQTEWESAGNGGDGMSCEDAIATINDLILLARRAPSTAYRPGAVSDPKPGAAALALLDGRNEAYADVCDRLGEALGWGALSGIDELLQVVRGYVMAHEVERLRAINASSYARRVEGSLNNELSELDELEDLRKFRKQIGGALSLKGCELHDDELIALAAEVAHFRHARPLRPAIMAALELPELGQEAEEIAGAVGVMVKFFKARNGVKLPWSPTGFSGEPPAATDSIADELWALRDLKEAALQISTDIESDESAPETVLGRVNRALREALGLEEKEPPKYGFSNKPPEVLAFDVENAAVVRLLLEEGAGCVISAEDAREVIREIAEKLQEVEARQEARKTPKKRSRSKVECPHCGESDGHTADECFLKPQGQGEVVAGLAPPEGSPTTSKPKPTRATKKFPLAAGPTERCTKCGRTQGAHDGTKCPPQAHGDHPDDQVDLNEAIEKSAEVEGSSGGEGTEVYCRSCKAFFPAGTHTHAAAAKKKRQNAQAELGDQ